MEEKNVCENCQSIIDFHKDLGVPIEEECSIANQKFREWLREDKHGVGQGDGCTRNDIYETMVNFHNALQELPQEITEQILKDLVSQYEDDKATAEALKYVYKMHFNSETGEQ